MKKNIDTLLTKYPELLKITPEIIQKIAVDIFGSAINFNKTWEENGVDELDIIEMVMEIEKILDIAILDDVVDALFDKSKRPFMFTQYMRNLKLEQLGID